MCQGAEPSEVAYNAGRYGSKDDCAKPPIEPRDAVCPENDFGRLLCTLHFANVINMLNKAVTA